MTDKRKAQLEQLENATRELMSETGFRRWIRTRNAFHSYSLNNQLLIACQPPKIHGVVVAERATRVAGFKAWKKLGRHVVKGATGIRILAPIKVTETDEQTGEETTRLWFKVVSVFDISQTDGEPLAEYQTRGFGQLDVIRQIDAVESLLELADELDVSVREDETGDAGGWFDRSASEIVVSESADGREQLRTLTHEIAHALGVGYKEFGRERSEQIVEAATTVALESIGFDTTGESLAYIASWGEADDLSGLREDLAKIDEVASRIEAALGYAD